jgi:superfamily II DNA or RNA helicase
MGTITYRDETCAIRPYQLQAVKFILDKKRALIADEMGLGKCCEAILAKSKLDHIIYNLQRPAQTLVVSPPSVVEHWEEEIRRWYYKHDDARIKVVESATFEEDVKEIRKANRRRDYFDFVIANYALLSTSDEHDIEKLTRLKFDYGIVDEVHNAKNPSAIRSRHVKQILDRAKYLALLSGTPVPNSILDIYMIMSLLEPENYKIPENNPRLALRAFYHLFKKNPDCVKNLFAHRMLRRTVEEIFEEKTIPDLEERVVEVPLTGLNAEVYRDIYYNDSLNMNTKLLQLQYAALDPNLVDKDFLQEEELKRRIQRLKERGRRMSSCKYKKLLQLVREEVERGGKVLTFVNFKEGVFDVLAEQHREFNPVIINGDVPSKRKGNGSSPRERARKAFQNDDEVKECMANCVMEEGVDLTRGTMVIHGEIGYTSEGKRQRIFRTRRLGEYEKESVESVILRATIPGISTVDEGKERLIEDKRKIIEWLLESPNLVSESDLRNAAEEDATKNKNFRDRCLLSPRKAVFEHTVKLRGKGGKRILGYYRKHPDQAEIYAENYVRDWENALHGNNAKILELIIRGLEAKHGFMDMKLDASCGPLTLSYTLQEGVYNSDIDEASVVQGLKRTQGLDNKILLAMNHELPYADSTFDLVVNTLAMQQAAVVRGPKKERLYEREAWLREFNRVMKVGGYALISLPPGIVVEEDLPKLYWAFNELGFEVLPFSGFVYGGDEFREHFFGLRKVEECCEGELGEEPFTWNMDKERKKRKRERPRKRESVSQFIFETKEGEKTLEEVLQNL